MSPRAKLPKHHGKPRIYRSKAIPKPPKPPKPPNKRTVADQVQDLTTSLTAVEADNQRLNLLADHLLVMRAEDKNQRIEKLREGRDELDKTQARLTAIEAENERLHDNVEFVIRAVRLDRDGHTQSHQYLRAQFDDLRDKQQEVWNLFNRLRSKCFDSDELIKELTRTVRTMNQPVAEPEAVVNQPVAIGLAQLGFEQTDSE